MFNLRQSIHNKGWYKRSIIFFSIGRDLTEFVHSEKRLQFTQGTEKCEPNNAANVHFNAKNILSSLI